MPKNRLPQKVKLLLVGNIYKGSRQERSPWLLLTQYCLSDFQCSMAEVWVCFSCCMSSSGSSNKRKPRRVKLDPSMIGAPANFQHLNHIGSGESGGNTVSIYTYQTIT
ncbi:unnamed protein product [Clavelina lepadiformis]|uniref:CRIB domain-containing protein n=1 Tax=Clavelina lepadiformis TaxID=159417 RepID=A0ABP0FJM3_CLALP